MVLSKNYLPLLFFITSFIGHAQEAPHETGQLKISPFFGFFESERVEGMALILKGEYARFLDDNLNAKQAYELSLGYCANGFIQYDEFGPGQSRPKSGVLVGLHSNWYYDLAPGFWLSPIGQLGGGLLMIKRTPASNVYDFYLSGNLGAGLRLGRANKPFNATMLLAGQGGYKPGSWFYAVGYQLGFEWRL